MGPRGLPKVRVEKDAPALNDLQLAQLAREDTKMEEVLLRRLYPQIFNVAWSIMGSRWLADEVSQVAAVQVVKSLDNFRGIGSLESWARRITCRVASKMLKKERRSNLLVPLVDEEHASQSEPIDRTLWRRNLFEKLLSEMARIPRKRRIPFQLHVVYGYTVSEVAEMTNVSPNTVKDRLRTVYKEIRKIMDENPNLRGAMLEAIS